MCCSPLSRKELDTTERLNNDNSNLPPITTVSGVPGGWPSLASQVPALPLVLAGQWLCLSLRARLSLQLYPGGVSLQSPL